ncbi:hypothetical protein [Polaromonas sp.]|uniref:hypothetical protein n=1 Tax=Polaromonas sp. TaxID=1869339 RepID=UPI00352B6661
MPLEIQPYDAVISKALKARGQKKDDFDRHPVHHEPRYVVRMCEAIVSLISQRGGRATLELVLRAERCASGHVDYQHKCALYCAEIEVGASALA